MWGKRRNSLKKYIMRWRGNMIMPLREGIQDHIKRRLLRRPCSGKGIISWMLPAVTAACLENFPNCTFAVSPCTPLGFENESMDVITVSCAFHHFETPQEFANECMRVLKKNGRVFIAEPHFSPVVRWLANVVVYSFSKTGDVRVYDQKEIRLFFELAGFTDMESYTTGSVLFFTARK